MKRFDAFINEKMNSELTLLLEGEINGSSNFVFKLNQLRSQPGIVGEIASEISNYITNASWVSDKDLKQNYFDVTDKEDTISFIQNNKGAKGDLDYDSKNSPYKLKGRSEIKIGRILKYLIGLTDNNLKVNDKDVESFVNAYKSLKEDPNLEFKIVKGQDVARFYREENYSSQSGQLGSSCMKGVFIGYFDIYVNNPSSVSLLVYIDNDKKIQGRALIWKLSKSPCDAKFFMDRIYTNKDSDILKFKKYADENNIMYKIKQQSNPENAVQFMYKNKEVIGNILVDLKSRDYYQYPFLDTLMYVNNDNTILSNLPFIGCYWLNSVEGYKDLCHSCDGDLTEDSSDLKGEECYSCSGSGEEDVDCPDCDGIGISDNDEDCETCFGTGISKEDCTVCDGDGHENFSPTEDLNKSGLCPLCCNGHSILRNNGISTELILKAPKKKK